MSLLAIFTTVRMKEGKKSLVCVCIQGATKSVATSSILKQLDNTHDIKRSEDLHHGNRNGTATESKKMNIQNAKSSKRWWFEGHVSVSVSLSLSRFLFVSLFFLSLCLFVSLSLCLFVSVSFQRIEFWLSVKEDGASDLVSVNVPKR